MSAFSLIPQTIVFHFIDAFLGASGFCVGVFLARPESFLTISDKQDGFRTSRNDRKRSGNDRQKRFLGWHKVFQ
jgi:hypothetical protein